MIDKDYSDWHTLKHQVHHSKRNRPSFKEREVWWCMIGLNVGNEQDGKGKQLSRPVLIVRKFSREIFLGVPLTTKTKDRPYYLPIHFKDRDQSALILQLRVFDAKRLTDKMGDLPQTDFEKVRRALRELL